MTRIEHQPIDYDPVEDLRQPPGIGAAGIVIAVLLLVAVLGMTAWGVVEAIRQNSPAPVVVPTIMSLPTETLTPTISPTPSATMDYCYWLTPSPEPSPTLAYTPDSWGATGTAVYYATNPPQTPTPLPPRELCDNVPTWTPVPDIFVRGVTATASPSPTLEVSPAYTLETAVAYTWTPLPTLPQIQPPAQVDPVIVTQPPIVITSPPVIITLPPPPPEQIIIVITATFMPPTETFTPTATFTPTHYEPLPTSSPTPTFTFAPTETLTPTPTETPTPTPTHTETITPRLE